jgi:hypothetical protein
MNRIEPEQWTQESSGWMCIKEVGCAPRPARIIHIYTIREGKREEIADIFYHGDTKRQDAIVQMILDAPILAAGKERAAFLEERVKVLEKAIRAVLAEVEPEDYERSDAFNELGALMYEGPEPQGSA